MCDGAVIRSRTKICPVPFALLTDLLFHLHRYLSGLESTLSVLKHLCPVIPPAMEVGSGGQFSPSVWPHNPATLQVSTSLGNSGLCWTVFARNRDTAVPAEGNGDLQTLICVLVARPRRCLTLSNHVPWQNWMAAYLGYTLRMRTLFRGWPIMVNDTHTRRRRRRRM